jgi:hypothetical protein
MHHEKLRTAVEALYQTFRVHKASRQMSVCEHCVNPEDVTQLFAKPLRELTADALGYYAFSAISTFGTADDFRHFLPRLFELLALESHELSRASAAGAEVLLGKLSQAGWREWPRDEQDAVEAYLTAFWGHALDQFPGEHDVDELLTGLGRGRGDLGPVLETWRVRAAVEAGPARHLAAFVIHNAAKAGVRQSLANAFWEGNPASMNEVIAWLRDSRTEQALEKAFFTFAGEPFASDLSQAVEALRALRVS